MFIFLSIQHTGDRVAGQDRADPLCPPRDGLTNIVRLTIDEQRRHVVIHALGSPLGWGIEWSAKPISGQVEGRLLAHESPSVSYGEWRAFTDMSRHIEVSLAFYHHDSPTHRRKVPLMQVNGFNM